jgi:hypothetical protein
MSDAGEARRPSGAPLEAARRPRRVRRDLLTDALLDALRPAALEREGADDEPPGALLRAALATLGEPPSILDAGAPLTTLLEALAAARAAHAGAAAPRTQHPCRGGGPRLFSVHSTSWEPAPLARLHSQDVARAWAVAHYVGAPDALLRALEDALLQRAVRSFAADAVTTLAALPAALDDAEQDAALLRKEWPRQSGVGVLHAAEALAPALGPRLQQRWRELAAPLFYPGGPALPREVPAFFSLGFETAVPFLGRVPRDAASDPALPPAEAGPWPASEVPRDAGWVTLSPRAQLRAAAAASGALAALAALPGGATETDARYAAAFGAWDAALALPAARRALKDGGCLAATHLCALVTGGAPPAALQAALLVVGDGAADTFYKRRADVRADALLTGNTEAVAWLDGDAARALLPRRVTPEEEDWGLAAAAASPCAGVYEWALEHPLLRHYDEATGAPFVAPPSAVTAAREVLQLVLVARHPPAALGAAVPFGCAVAPALPALRYATERGAAGHLQVLRELVTRGDSQLATSLADRVAAWPQSRALPAMRALLGTEPPFPVSARAAAAAAALGHTDVLALLLPFTSADGRTRAAAAAAAAGQTAALLSIVRALNDVDAGALRLNGSILSAAEAHGHADTAAALRADGFAEGDGAQAFEARWHA